MLRFEKNLKTLTQNVVFSPRYFFSCFSVFVFFLFFFQTYSKVSKMHRRQKKFSFEIFYFLRCILLTLVHFWIFVVWPFFLQWTHFFFFFQITLKNNIPQNHLNNHFMILCFKKILGTHKIYQKKHEKKKKNTKKHIRI